MKRPRVGADAGREAAAAVRLRLSRRPRPTTAPVWAAGELLQFGGDFNKYVTSKQLQKQEGIIFRHLLRLILLANELSQLCPPDTTEGVARRSEDIADRLTACCRGVDPTSTDKALEEVERRRTENMPKEAVPYLLWTLENFVWLINAEQASFP